MADPYLEAAAKQRYEDRPPMTAAWDDLTVGERGNELASTARIIAAWAGDRPLYREDAA